MSRSSRGTDPARAVSAAKRATALAGHPDVSWSIVLGARVEGPPPLKTDVSDRLAAALTGWYLRMGFWRLTAVYFVATASHGLLDVLTTGGNGAALWWPVSGLRDMFAFDARGYCGA